MESNKQEHKPGTEQKKSGAHKRSALWYLAYAAIAAMFVFGIYLIVIDSFIIVPPIEAPPTFSAAPATPAPTPAPAAAPTPTPEPTPYVQVKPVRIYFTASSYWSNVYPVGIVEGTEAEIATVDNADDAGWFELGAAPRESGNCIISGHNRKDGKMGVFSYLKEMEIGEEVVVELENGEFVYYEVMEIEEFAVEGFPQEYLARKGPDRLTLITCKGDYSRRQQMSLTRVVVVCKEKTGVQSEPLTPPEAAEPDETIAAQ